MFVALKMGSINKEHDAVKDNHLCIATTCHNDHFQ